MRLSEEEYEALLKRRGKGQIKPVDAVSTQTDTTPPPKRGKPNKTESEYGRRLALEYGVEPRFEAITFRLKCGHAYTPDWFVPLSDGRMLCVEVKARGKNGFRHPSYQRAKLAFSQAKLDFPQFIWVWAEKCKGEWDVCGLPGTVENTPPRHTDDLTFG